MLPRQQSAQRRVSAPTTIHHSITMANNAVPQVFPPPLHIIKEQEEETKSNSISSKREARERGHMSRGQSSPILCKTNPGLNRPQLCIVIRVLLDGRGVACRYIWRSVNPRESSKTPSGSPQMATIVTTKESLSAKTDSDYLRNPTRQTDQADPMTPQAIQSIPSHNGHL